MAWTGVITNQGEKLLSEWMDEAVCRITGAYVGSGTVKEAVMLAQTDVAGTKREAGIVAHKTVNQGRKISVQVQAGETEYRLYQIGIWASLNGASAVMLALFQNEEGVRIPAQAESPDFVYNFHAVLSVSSQGELQVTMDPSALVSQGSMQAAIAAACEEKQDKLTGAPGQIVGFNENGEVEAQELPEMDGGPYYATCSTAAGTTAKTVSCEGFTLKTGAAVIVKFTYYNTATSPTLNVNGTGAKYIKKYGTTGGIAYMWYSGEMVQFVYDGTNWVMTKGMTATTTYYGLTKLSGSTDSYSTTEAATPSAVRQVNLTANEALALVKEHTHDARDVLVSAETAKSLDFPEPINLVRNGSFEELEYGWELVSANVTHPKWSEAPDGYYVLDILDTWGGDGVVKQTLSQPLNSTHVYYFSMEANTYNGASSATVVLIAGNLHFTLTERSDLQESWTRLSVCVSGIQGDSIRINYVDYNSAYIDSIMLIDLTEAFGAGKEPDKMWCNANLTFDNTKCPTVDEALEELAGRTDTGAALVYGGDGEAGKFDRLSTAPTATNPLRYNGVFRATKVFGIYFSDSADLAETYAVEGAWEWGDLIAIGADGLLRRNEMPENRRVLGFASQRPGVVLGGVEGVPIALAGRVPVRAEGVICAGDFLSAGTEPGTVRRADLDAVPRGSVVAMALEDKPASDVGPVLALVQRM